MRIRIPILTLTRIRTSTVRLNAEPDPYHLANFCSRLHFESPHLYCERPRPSMAPFCASKALEFDFDADLDADSAFENNVDSDSQPSFFNYICAFFFLETFYSMFPP